MADFLGITLQDKFSLILDQDELLLKFPFNKQRFNFVKDLTSANYDKIRKLWQIPIINLEKLISSGEFDLRNNRSEFDLNLARDTYLQVVQKITIARQKLLVDPFSVSLENINLLELDLKLMLSSKRDVVRISASRAGRRLVYELTGRKTQARDKTFSFPAEHLNSLLKSARDQNLSFAVHEDLSLVLKKTAELRYQASQGKCLNYQEYQQALLQPIIEYSGFYVLSGESLIIRSLLKNISAKTQLDLMQVDTLFGYSIGANTRIWMTDNFLNSEVLQSPLLKALIKKTGACWLMLAEHIPGLICHEDSLAKIKTEFPEIIATAELLKLTSFPEILVYRFSGRSLLELSKYLEKLPQSLKFTKFIEQSLQGLKLVSRNENFRTLNDYDLKLTHQEIVKDLFPHQRVAVAWLLETEQALLGDDMGLGKTLSVLCCFDELRAKNKIDAILVVCPASLVNNWLRETNRWTANLKLSAVPEGKKERQSFLNKLDSFTEDGLVINYESLRLPYVFPEFVKFCSTHRVLLVLDESQRIKNPVGKTFKALATFARMAKKRILLSGTPTPKDISDIWSQMFILDGGERLGRNYYEWLSNVAELGNKYSEYAVRSYKQREVDDTIFKVQELLLRRKKEDVIDLPEKLFSIRDVKLAGEQKRLYDLIRNELILELTALNGEKFRRELTNILERYLRAVQVAVNPRLLFSDYQGDPAKFLELDEIVTEIVRANRRKLIVWTNYLKNIDELMLRYPDLKLAEFSGRISKFERDKIVTEFQSEKGGADIIFAIPAAGGVGITLTAAQTAIYLDKTWNAEHWLQSVDRIHRIGQRGTVNIISLHSAKVDELISRSLDKKSMNQARLLGDVDQVGFELKDLIESLY